MKKALVALVLTALLACTLPAVAGCGDGGGQDGPAPVEETSPAARQDGASDPSRTVTMNGRSVMTGWFEHWGYDWEGPVSRGGYLLDFKELDASDIANLDRSFESNVEGLPAGSVVFFKFCFADFDGSNLSMLEDVVERVIGVARGKGLKLIIGNALPVRSEEGNPQMVEEYEKYNAFLDEQAQKNPGVYVFDFYGVLADEEGYLRSEYQTEDSHPNGDAYAALDERFFPFLNEVFSK